MKYWDASALVPLLVAEPDTAHRVALFRRDRHVVTWWGSAVECASAIQRLHRAGNLNADELTKALGDLETMSAGWTEMEPSEGLRRRAQRLLGVHPLRAADALQLAAALVAADERPPMPDFVCGDNRLSEAARREGFAVL